jgi:hypothetical protein
MSLFDIFKKKKQTTIGEAIDLLGYKLIGQVDNILLTDKGLVYISFQEKKAWDKDLNEIDTKGLNL